MDNESLDISPHKSARSQDRSLLHPEEVVGDPLLSMDEKRSLLTAWASDAHAVPDEPTLRQLDNGAVVSLASIIEALETLDGQNGRSCVPANKTGHHPGRRHDQILTKWRRRALWPHRKRNDDDDEPPPAPIAMFAPSRNPAWA